MPTRRSALIALILVIVVMIVLLVLATRASAPTLTESEATETAWAEIDTEVYATAVPNLTAAPTSPTPTP